MLISLNRKRLNIIQLEQSKAQLLLQSRGHVPVATVCPSGCIARHRISSSCSVLCTCVCVMLLNTIPTAADK